METLLTTELLDDYDNLFVRSRQTLLRTFRQVGDDFWRAHDNLVNNPILHENFVTYDVMLNMRYFDIDDKEDSI